MIGTNFVPHNEHTRASGGLSRVQLATGGWEEKAKENEEGEGENNRGATLRGAGFFCENGRGWCGVEAKNVTVVVCGSGCCCRR